MIEVVKEYWEVCVGQKENELCSYFHPSASIRWHNTNELFNVEEFIRANCEYPNIWLHEIERIEVVNQLYICVVRVWSLDISASFHVTSFIQFDEDKISEIDEYWGDDGNPPTWRVEKVRNKNN